MNYIILTIVAIAGIALGMYLAHDTVEVSEEL